MQKEFEMCLGYQKIVETLFFIEGTHKLETGDYMIVSRRLLSIITNTVYFNNKKPSHKCLRPINNAKMAKFHQIWSH